MITQTKEIYSTKEAAEYLGLSVQGIKHHIYTSGDLVPDAKIGRNLVFTKATLDNFESQKRTPGRPPEKTESHPSGKSIGA